MQSVSKLTNLHGKKVILRLDLNVPLKNGEITDTTRIDKVLPTIEFLLKQNSKIIILSHVGRPKGKVIRDLSLKPIKDNIAAAVQFSNPLSITYLGTWVPTRVI